jgi:hypothetical protein
MRTRHVISALGLAGLATAGLVQPASAAPGGEFLDIRQEGCELIATVQFEDPGTYYLNAWDDGSHRGGVEVVTTTPGEVREVTYVIVNEILQGAAGLGVYIEDGLGLAAVETFDSNGSYAGADLVGAACEASAGVDPGIDPAVGVTANPGVVEEGAAGTLTFTRDFPGFARTVTYTLGGDAVADDDFAALAGTVVIPDGARSVTVPVEALDDGVDEADRSLVVTLVDGAAAEPAYTLGDPATAALAITDAAVVPVPVPEPAPAPVPVPGAAQPVTAAPRFTG